MNNLHASLTAEAKRLLSLGYKVMPIKHKASMTSIYKEEFENYDGRVWPGQTGIAVVCSQDSGVVALDIDVDDKGLIDSILNIAPSNIIKIGGKGLTAFYQMPESIDKKTSRGYNIVNPNESERKETPYVRVGVFDLLANNTVTVMPPSQHFVTDKVNDTIVPSGKYYRYESSPLPEKDYLPIISQSQVDSILAVVDSYCMARNQSGDDHASIKHSGRNHKLTAIASAILFREANLVPYAELTHSASNEVYEYDRLNHSPRLFTQASEGFKSKDEKDALNNASKFVDNILDSIKDEIKKNSIKPKQSAEVAVEKFEYKDYPRPTGVLQALQDYILESSYTYNPNMALGTAMSIVGTIIGNKISFDDTLANNFYFLLSPAGGGKSSAIKAVKRPEIINDEHLFPGSFSSSQAVIKTVFDNCEVLCTNDELSKLLKQIKNGNEWQQGIVQELASIWSASGGRYELQAQSYKSEEERKNAKKFIINPYMSFLGATTFSELMDNVEITMFSSGFFPRCLFFIDGERRDKRRVFLDNNAIAETLDAATLACKLLNDSVIDFMNKNKPTSAKLGYNFEASEPSPRANIVSNECIKAHLLTLDSKLESLRSEAKDDHIKLMIDRGFEHIKKIAIIAAFSDFNTTILPKHLDWAFELFTSSLYNATPTFNIAASQGYDDKLANKCIDLIKKAGKISNRDLSTKLKIKSKASQQLLEDLISKGLVDKVVSKSISGRSRVLFFAKTDASEE